MAIRIQLRRGTAAEWTSVNPVLAEGEMGWELDTRLSKLGNGTSAWVDLPYTATGSVAWPAASDFRTKLRTGRYVTQLWDPLTALYYDLSIITVDGQRTLGLSDTGEA